MKYLSDVWGLVQRPEEQSDKFYNSDRQDALVEALEETNIIKDVMGKGDVTLFNSQCLHRGPASNGIGYAFFAAWSTKGYNATGLHTDGIPIHKANWEGQFKKWLVTSKETEDHMGNKFYALANKLMWNK